MFRQSIAEFLRCFAAESRWPARCRGLHRFGLLDPLEELAGIRRKRLDISPLAFGINRVERERRFAGAADAGNNRQCVMRDLKVDVLEVVNPNPANKMLSIPARFAAVAINQPLYIAEMLRYGWI